MKIVLPVAGCVSPTTPAAFACRSPLPVSLFSQARSSPLGTQRRASHCFGSLMTAQEGDSCLLRLAKGVPAVSPVAPSSLRFPPAALLLSGVSSLALVPRHHYCGAAYSPFRTSSGSLSRSCHAALGPLGAIAFGASLRTISLLFQPFLGHFSFSTFALCVRLCRDSDGLSDCRCWRFWVCIDTLC